MTMQRAADYMDTFVEETRDRIGIDPSINIRILAHRKDLGMMFAEAGTIVYKKNSNGKIVGCDIRVDELASRREAENIIAHELNHLKKYCEGKESCETDAYIAGFKRELYSFFSGIKNFIYRRS